MANVFCNKCRQAYRIEPTPKGAEFLRCSDCAASFHTYDQGDVAVVGMPIDQLSNMPHSGGICAANDNQPDPVRPEVREAYADPKFPWPFGGKAD